MKKEDKTLLYRSTKKAINKAVAEYTRLKIAEEIEKNLEDIIFFSSYTIGASVFRKATNKLKKKLKEKDFSGLNVWADEAQMLVKSYHLEACLSDELLYQHLLVGLLRAQIKINEALLFHFTSLHKKAHDFDYLQRRIEQIHTLLFE